MIRHFWLFLAVAEELHFGRAAQRLGMSQPPLTEQIQALEQALGIRLFDRNRRGVRLTPAGAAILPAVRKFVEQMQRLELAVREAVEGQAGLLTVGAISSAMLEDLPPLVAALRSSHPGLRVSVKEIDSVDAIPLLEAGDIDLAFARLEGELGQGVRSLHVAQDCLAVALPLDHRLAARDFIDLPELAEEDFAMFSRRFSPIYYDHVLAACRENGFAPRILHEVRSINSQIAFVGCGQGVALVPSRFERLAPPTVVVRPLRKRVEIVAAALVWSASRHNLAVETVVSMVQSVRDAAPS